MNLKSTKKEIIILRHNGGRLGNQLLLYCSVYAFCLEYGYKCINYSFYKYSDYFDNIPKDKFTLFLAILAKVKLFRTRREHLIIYQIYILLSYICPFFKRGTIIKEIPGETINLPPTNDKIKTHQQLIQKIAHEKNHVIYIDGWNFRNPIGFKKYYQQITRLFRPTREIIDRVESFLKPFKNNYYLVGIHIRQGDYKSKGFMNGEWYYTEKETAGILRDYLIKENKNIKNTLFIICSDGPIDLSYFKGLNIRKGPGTMMEDLLTLSMCKIIIGANSSFGSFAAYYGKIPYYILEHKDGYIKSKKNNLFQV